LKLTTDRHEASHGLFATAELFVHVWCDNTRSSAVAERPREALCRWKFCLFDSVWWC